MSLAGPELHKVLTSIIVAKREADTKIIYEDLIEKLTSYLRPKKILLLIRRPLKMFIIYKYFNAVEDTIQNSLLII